MTKVMAAGPLYFVWFILVAVDLYRVGTGKNPAKAGSSD